MDELLDNLYYNLYIGAEVTTGNWYPEVPGERILEGVYDNELLRIAVHYPNLKESYDKQIILCPKSKCQLILRSMDDDITEEENKEIKKIGFTISQPRKYILCEDGTPSLLLRIQPVSELLAYLIKQKFSVGLFSKKHYIIKTRQKT